MMEATSPLVLLIGSQSERLTKMARESLVDHVNIQSVVDVAEAERVLDTGRLTPALIVIVQRRPGEWSEEGINHLRRAAPLACVWRLLESWCEGEPRSGHPPLGCTNVYSHQWTARIARELAGARDGQIIASATLPATIGADERTIWEDQQDLPRGNGTVAIVASSTETADSLADVCRLAGYNPVTVAGGCDPGINPLDLRALIWDCEPKDFYEPGQVGRVRRIAAGAPIVAVVGFPRAEDIDRARNMGIAVVAKPFVLRDLVWCLMNSHKCAPSPPAPLPRGARGA